MDTLIGFLELLGWIAVVLALASTITYAVIKATMALEARRGAEAEAPPPQGD